MTICREWSLVKHLPGMRLAKPLYCRSWGCEECAPRRRAQLMAKAASGEPTRFITLTVNPNVGLDPDDRLLMLADAWRKTWKRLLRLHPQKNMAFLAIVEATKRGEPHLHILFRGPYIPQSWLSACMAELLDSPIVDIRKIRKPKEVIRYVAKYLTKSPHRFGTGKRYWNTQNWEPAQENDNAADSTDWEPWRVSRESIGSLVLSWYREGYLAKGDGKQGLVAYQDDSLFWKGAYDGGIPIPKA